MEGGSEGGFAAGEYALTFGTGEYFRQREIRSFYPKVTITFTVTSGHHHVPLLLSPFAYSTYRGS
jgi:5-hydroxyisourate hydrolase